ncbi:tripartite tricarboxylate transporter substrate binding protein [Pseudalkalibacillus caeni]|uniref:Tripartite tricarboxylate transporter substrate binding protein n=1 Tax=Exobacillus caeni TaxID=2574798 RepID=A0A5R9FG78_9BACL|nr:tripartite tricarboxylate transporter substrate binding protein [Pseudalkalibacillus caeni]TLS38545.1 tripartite tricarboxylate transporter substrate binding protein [Pseudalkalibacillus caeni]
MFNKRSLLFSLVLVIALVLSACGSNQSSGNSGNNGNDGQATDDWKPEKPIEVIAPAGAGGGWDTTARTVSKVMEQTNIIDKRLAVVNKPGGGGAVGWAYVDKKGGNHTLFVTSPPILFVPLNGQSDLGHNDFTPIAGVIADYAAFVVSADSPYNNMNDLIEALKEDPQSISVVGDSAPGSMDHMQFVKAVKAGGVDVKRLKYVSAQDGSGMSMLLGGKVDVYSTGLAEATEQARAGKVKVLAITAPEPLEGETVSEFKTLKEQGIDDQFVVWRGFMGPKDMDPEAVAYYENAIKEMMETDEWKEQRDNFGWNDNYMSSEEFKKFLDEEYKTMEELMNEVGLKK